MSTRLKICLVPVYHGKHNYVVVVKITCQAGRKLWLTLQINFGGMGLPYYKLVLKILRIQNTTPIKN